MQLRRGRSSLPRSRRPRGFACGQGHRSAQKTHAATSARTPTVRLDRYRRRHLPVRTASCVARFGPTSMRQPLSRRVRDECGISQISNWRHRPRRSAMRVHAVAPIEHRGVTLRHVGPRDAIETDVKHGCLLKSMYLGTAATGFHFTRLTEASFIVSTPKSIDLEVAGVDQTEALCTRLKGILAVLAPGCRIAPIAGPPRRCRSMLAHGETLRFDINPLRPIFKCGALLRLPEPRGVYTSVPAIDWHDAGHLSPARNLKRGRPGRATRLSR
jgi:hypothetical protein